MQLQYLLTCLSGTDPTPHSFVTDIEIGLVVHMGSNWVPISVVFLYIIYTTVNKAIDNNQKANIFYPHRGYTGIILYYIIAVYTTPEIHILIDVSLVVPLVIALISSFVLAVPTCCYFAVCSCAGAYTPCVVYPTWKSFISVL